MMTLEQVREMEYKAGVRLRKLVLLSFGAALVLLPTAFIVAVVRGTAKWQDAAIIFTLWTVIAVFFYKTKKLKRNESIKYSKEPNP